MKNGTSWRAGLRTSGGIALFLLPFSCSSGAPERTIGTEPGDLETQQTQTQPLLEGGRLFCGGPEDWQCADGAVCLPFAAGCPSPDMFGLCVPAPTRCFPIPNPVCGCDGSSYDNICETLKAGTAVQHAGPCEDAGPPMCGGEMQRPCPGSGSCVDENGDVCGRGENTDCVGECVCKAIEKCSRGEVWDPDPAACACVPAPPDACGNVECPERTQCVTHPDGTTSCERLPDK